MTLIGSQDTGLGSVDTASGGAGDGGGDIEEITSTDGSVTITGPTGPITDLSVPAAQPPASAVTGLSFPIVAGVPTLSAGSPVVLPGQLGVEGELFADDGLQVTGDALVTGNAQVDGTTTLLGALDANGGIAAIGGITAQGGIEAITGSLIADAGVPTTLHGTLEVDGATTMNGALSANNGAAISGAGTINGLPIAPEIVATSVNTTGTKLSAISAANLTAGSTLAWVNTVGAFFLLQISALAVDHLTVETASGLVGAQWLRMNLRNPVWQAQTSWTVNTATGNDESAGTGGAPLKTMSEVARRLSFASLSATTVTLTGNMAAGDNPVWTFNASAEVALTITGTPTTLYTGSVTTAVNVSPAPTTTENDLTDTAIPVSFTASGLLGNGVLFSFTSGIAGSAFWAAKDLGAKTIRISQPHAAFGTDHAFANGETYTASQLPSTQQMTFAGNLTGGSVLWQNVTFPAGIAINENCHIFEQCWFASPNVASNGFENCAFQGSGTQWGAGVNNVGAPVYVGGMWRGSGGNLFTLFGASNASGSSKFTFQGCGLLVTNGAFLGVTSDMLFYDVTLVNGALQATYWSEMMTTAAFGGSNNTALAGVSKMSQIAHTTSPGFIAGASTATNPIIIPGTVGSPITVAAESASVGVVNAFQNGIYVTG